MKNLNQIKLLHIALFFIAIILVALSVSCKKSSEKVSEKMIEQAIGEDADVNIGDEKMVIETDEGTFTVDATKHSWPKDIPNDVPEFKEGKIINVTTIDAEDGNNWTMVFEEVDTDAFDKYKKVLKAKDFKTQVITMGATHGHIMAEKGDLIVVMMSGDGTTSLSVAVEK